jgi:tetratricopeptide (TPR) repeat protein
MPHGFTNAYYNLGNAYAQKKDTENAIFYFKKAIAESPHEKPDCVVPAVDPFNSLGALVESYTNLAVMYMIEN